MVYLYGKKLPKINELIVVNIVEVNALNVIGKLIDYNDLTCYISYSELLKKKRENISNIVSVGKNKTAIVNNINLEKNYVELSLKNISITDIEKFTISRKKYSNLYNLWRWIYTKINPEISIESLDNDKLNQFMEDTLRQIESNNKGKFVDILETLLDKESNLEIISVIKNQDIDKIKIILDEYINLKTIIVKPTKDIEVSLTSYELSGSSNIKESLDYKSFNFYKDIEQDYLISITYLSDSNYRISIGQIDTVLINNNYPIDRVYTELIQEIKFLCAKFKIFIKI